MDARDGKKRFETCSNALPPDHQAAILLLEPGKSTLGLEPGHRFFDGSASGFLGLPDALGELCPNATLPEPLPQGFRIIAFIGGKDFESFAGAAAGARPHLDRVEQRHHLGALIPIGRRGAMRQGHAIARRETMDEDPLAFAATGDALTPALPRGKKRHPPPPRGRLWGHDVNKQAPLQLTQALESACHTVLLSDWETV